MRSDCVGRWQKCGVGRSRGRERLTMRARALAALTVKSILIERGRRAGETLEPTRRDPMRVVKSAPTTCAGPKRCQASSSKGLARWVLIVLARARERRGRRQLAVATSDA